MTDLDELYQRYIATVGFLTNGDSAASVDGQLDVLVAIGDLSDLLTTFINGADGFRVELSDQCFDLSIALKSAIRWADDSGEHHFADKLNLLTKLAIAILLAYRQPPKG